MTKVYLWAFTWALIAGASLFYTSIGNYDVAIWLMVIQFAPAIWTGQAWDRYQDPERRWD